MQELSKALNDFAENGPDTANLRNAAKSWASFCIQNLDKNALELGINIASSIALFLNALEDK